MMPPRMVSYAFSREEAIIQLPGMGPWDIKYIHPDDDPRKQK